jgi:hypothetical protein
LTPILGIQHVIEWPSNKLPLPKFWNSKVTELCCCSSLPTEVNAIIFSKWVIIEERAEAIQKIKDIFSIPAAKPDYFDYY